MIGLSLLLPALAYRPFLDPLPVHHLWLALLVPLTLAIALVYKALRLPTLERLWSETARLTVTIIASMAAAAIVLYYITEWL